MAGRFAAPWHADKTLGGYVVRDANGRALAYIYSRDNESEALQAKVLTKGRGAPDRPQRGAVATVGGKGDRDTCRQREAAAFGLTYWRGLDRMKTCISLSAYRGIHHSG
jgi:hypothetical protein